MKRKVTVRLYRGEFYGDEFPESNSTLDEAMKFLKEQRAKIPRECLPSAKVVVDSVGGYEGEHHATVSITYERDETDEEHEARAAQSAAYEERKKADDLRTLAELQAKYGPKP